MAVSYTLLYDLVRRERGHQELQELPALFYDEAKDYLKELQIATHSPSLSSAEQARVQLINTRKLLRQLYEYREQKIMLLAQNRCKTGSTLVDTTRLLAAEKDVYEQLISVLKYQRTKLGLEDLQVPAEEPPVAFSTPVSPTPAPATPVAPVQPAAVIVQERIVIRVVKPVAAFMGKGMETFGPYTENERVELPATVAQVLIRKGNAQLEAEDEDVQYEDDI